MKRHRIALLAAGLAAAGMSYSLADDAKTNAPVAKPAVKSDTKAESKSESKAETAPGEFKSQADAINHFIRDGYKKAKILAPAARATDDEFLRRTFIDLLGRVASHEEVVDFEQDGSPNKRAKLVNRLLYGVKNAKGDGREYTPKVNGQPVKIESAQVQTYDYPDELADNWANMWTIWTMSRTGNNLYRQQMQLSLYKEFIAGTNHKDLVTKLLTAKGANNVDGLTNFIIHHLGEPTAADKRAEVGPFDAVPITSRVTRLFLGVQTNCTQCHDHPFNKEWTQADFWGVNAFFRQTLRDRTPTGGMERRMENPVFVSLSDDDKYNNEQIIFYERRDGKLMASKPNFLKDLAVAESGDPSQKPIGKSAAKSRREVLADYVTKHDNFAKAYVNRVWGHLFGRGLNKEASIDDFGSHNEVVHPELLEYLAAEFVKYNYDQKKLLEWICTSEVYSLSHVANTAYVDPKYEAYFARMPLKAMPPEVLFKSLETVTRAELTTTDKTQRRTARETFEAKLVRNFGDDEGNEMTFNGTVVQALLMMNGTEINREIVGNTKSNPVERIIAKHNKSGPINSAAVIDEIFVTVLNRHPNAAEKEKINGIMTKGAVIAGEKPGAAVKPAPAPVTPTPSAKPGDKKGANPIREAMQQKKGGASAPIPEGPRAVNASGPNDKSFYKDLFWALLNTNEFMLNH